MSQWRAGGTPLAVPADAARMTRRQLVVRGWAVNAVNPKGTVFLLAVVPSFIDASAKLLPQYAAVALTLGTTDLVVMAGYTALASRVLRAWSRPRQVRWMNRAFGGLFCVAGTLLAAFRRAG